ncbi:MAG: hypothetical protein K2X66_18615, partial [Cyanobacteria bacterium]|nr:hypothetical protein [Cyanobacteriota bacterium]
MDIALSAGKIGTQAISQLLPEIGKLTSQATQLGKQEFSKLMHQLDGISGKLKNGKGPDALQSIDHLLHKPVKNEISSDKAAQFLNQLDKNKDGQVDQSEITNGLAAIDSKMKGILQKSSSAGQKTGLSSENVQEIRQLKEMQKFATNLQKHFNQLAPMDFDKSGISQDDVKIMASADNRPK